MTRRVAGVVIIDGSDHEHWPFDNELVHYEHNVQMLLDEGAPAQALGVPHVRWGGECRVELDLMARVVGDNAVQVEGRAKLFEGTSDTTTDLEDDKVVVFTIPKGGVAAHHSLNLHNTEFDGGDWATIRFSFTNSVVE